MPLQFPAAAANAVILLGITIMIISALTRIVDIRKELRRWATSGRDPFMFWRRSSLPMCCFFTDR